MALASMRLKDLTFGKLAQVAKSEMTMAKYNTWLDGQISGYYTKYVKAGKIAPYFHAMAASSLLSFGAMYPYALEEHIEKNPARFFRGQLGLTMKDYLAPEPEHHFTNVLSTKVALTTGGH